MKLFITHLAAATLFKRRWILVGTRHKNQMPWLKKPLIILTQIRLIRKASNKVCIALQIFINIVISKY